jgi:hypothetical protein
MTDRSNNIKIEIVEDKKSFSNSLASFLSGSMTLSEVLSSNLIYAFIVLIVVCVGVAVKYGLIPGSPDWLKRLVGAKKVTFDESTVELEPEPEPESDSE